MKEIILPGDKLAYEYEDIAFVNTSLFTETARFYQEHKCYTTAPEGSIDFKQFWDIEEDRLLNGMSAPGKLYYDEKNIPRIQEVRITGEHYGYLNFGRIKRTVDTQDALYGGGNEAILKNRKLVGKKEISFPDFWDGDYHYFKAVELGKKTGKHIIVFKARRKGYSYKNGYLCAHDVNFISESTAIIGAYEKKFLIQGSGTTKMAKNYLDWYQEKTDFYRGYLSNDIENIEMGYQLFGDKMHRGYRSKLLTVSFMDNPDAVIGKDGDRIIFEEAGKFPNIRETLEVTLSATEDGEIQTGQIIIFGTGGTDEANWIVFEDLFYNPDKNDFLAFHNVWDEGRRGSSCGFFHGHLLTLIPHIDEHGNSQLEKAAASVEKIRERKRQSFKTEAEYTKYIGQRCITPSEGFSSSGSSIFASATLTQHTEKVTNDPVYKNMGVPGVVHQIGEDAVFKPNFSLEPHERHDPLLKYQDTTVKDWNGCVVTYQPPFKIRDAENKLRVPNDLYRIWHDPVAMKKETGSITYRGSLGTAYVYEKPNGFTPTKGDVIVASYIGRPEDPDDYNKQLLALSLLYNAEVVFERDRGDVHRYFKAAGYEHKLAWEPTFNFNKALQGKRKFREKGILISEGSKRKEAGALLLRKWLNSERTKNIELNTITLALEYFYDLGGLEELKIWNLKGNFDRVSALIIGMLDREEIFHVEPENLRDTRVKDDFFSREFF